MKTLFWLASITVLALIATTSRLLPAQEVGAALESDVAMHMHEHLNRITTIKSLIIMGNLDGVREPAAWLADHEAVAGLPTNYEPYVGLMREYAREVNNATDLKSAAISVSNMARTCSNCHLVNEIEIEFGYDQRPAEWSDTVSHMQRHQWAADRLWEGLIGPSDAAWDRGTDMLIDVPLQPDDVLDEASVDVDSDALDQITHRIHVLAGQGASARTPTQRSELYGEMLGLCAECHTRLGRGPGQ
jgi:cytochrome c553